MQQIAYRSPGLAAGFLNTLGRLHIHVDSFSDEDITTAIVRELELRGNPGKINRIYDFIAGHQRELLPAIYKAHTPTTEQQEALDFFSTTLVHSRDNAIEVVNFIGKELRGTSGAIVELEQVVGWLEAGKWQWLDTALHISNIEGTEVEFVPQLSWPFEVHHGFDLAKTVPLVSLTRLLRFCRQSKVVVGGWFIFDKGDRWACRSNAFRKSPGLHQSVQNEQQAISRFLQEEGYKIHVRTLVEKVIGIWHSQA